MPIKEEIEEDFLEVDKQIPGQNYVCLSFVSPEKVLNQKEKFLFYHYQRLRLLNYKKLFTDTFNTLVEENEDGTVEISRLFDMRKSMEKLFEEDNLTFDTFREKFDDYKFRDEQKINEDFDKSNDFKTSVRGLKVRGVYDTRREAEVRAKVLQRQDQSFDVFVGQIGYWLPWDPSTNNVEDQEYLNNDLNTLVKEYKKNEAKKDMFYQEQKAQRTAEATTTAQRLREKLDAKKKLEEEAKKITEINDDSEATQQSSISSQELDNTTIKDNLNLDKLSSINTDLNVQEEDTTANTSNFDVGDKNSKTVSMDETIENLNQTDPWLQRKMEQK